MASELSFSRRLARGRRAILGLFFAATLVYSYGCSSDSSSTEGDAGADAATCQPTVLTGDDLLPEEPFCPDFCGERYTWRRDRYLVCTMGCASDAECPEGYNCLPTGLGGDRKICIATCTATQKCPEPMACPQSGAFPRACH